MQNGTQTSVTVTNVVNGTAIEVNTSQSGLERPFDLQTFTIVPASDTDFQLGITRWDETPAGTPAFDTANGNALGYFEIDHSQPDSEISSVRFNFRVSKQRLSERGVPMQNVKLYRYHDGVWIELDTTPLGETADGDAYRYTTKSPGLSVFALGATQGETHVTSASLNTTSVTAGDAVEVTATVENSGQSETETTVSVTANDNIVAERNVTVAGGKTKQVTFSPTFSEAGTYDIAVNGISAGTLTVEPTETPTRSPTSTVTSTPGDGDDESPTETEPPSSGGFNGVMLIGLLMLVLLGVGAPVAYLYNEGQFDDLFNR